MTTMKWYNHCIRLIILIYKIIQYLWPFLHKLYYHRHKLLLTHFLIISRTILFTWVIIIKSLYSKNTYQQQKQELLHSHQMLNFIFSKIKFNILEPVLRLQQTDTSRNNIQLSGEFSSQTYTSYNISKYISKPRLLTLTQTKSIIVIIDIMTTLCYILQRKKFIIGYGIALAKNTVWEI